MIIVTILDESGSMESIKPSTISGFNEFVEDRKKDVEENEKELTKFIKITFNGDVKVDEYTNIDDIGVLNDTNYCPNGMTALYDAIGRGLDLLKDNREDDVWFIIITDGLENRSKTYDRDEIKAKISKYKAYKNWNFIFCGANQDSYLTSASIGMDGNDTVVNFTPDAVSVGALYRGISRQVSSGGAEMYNPSPKFSTKRPTLVRDTSI